MINNEIFNKILTAYKANFKTHFADEVYKWQAITHFQKHWDIDAPDFGAMFKESVSHCSNLLAAAKYFPAGMIIEFANADPEAARQMFRRLYDETRPVTERVTEFIAEAERLRIAHDNGKWYNHYQNANSVSTYLWLRFPDKYFIYKYSEAKAVAHTLESSFIPKHGANAENLNGAFALYDEIAARLLNDSELHDLFNSLRPDDAYPDPNFHTLAIDFGFFISRKYENIIELSWWPDLSFYDPKLTVADWKSFLADPNIFTPADLALVKRFHDIGGVASCKLIADTYGNTAQHYNLQATLLCRRIAEHHQVPLLTTAQNEPTYFTIAFQGRNAIKNEVGSYVWKMRDELMQAVAETDLSHIPLHENIQSSSDTSTSSQPTDIPTSYSKKDFERDVFMENIYDDLVAMLDFNKNIILQGAPGVGKTFAAKRLAYAIMGQKDQSRIEFIQFHQNYSYEDFVMGFRPKISNSETGDTDGTFKLKTGIFYRFCKKATEGLGETPDKDQKFFFIIDEINRGNLSKIFGELFMTIEKSHRDEPVTLAYNGEKFAVPRNVYLIGMMNTADRSIALVDYALRRRFCFFTMTPAFDSAGFKTHLNQIKNQSRLIEPVIRAIKVINAEISKDPSLGPGFLIGHSYFTNLNPTNDYDLQIKNIVKYNILPMLEEYWFDDRSTYDKQAAILKAAIKEPISHPDDASTNLVGA